MPAAGAVVFKRTEATDELADADADADAAAVDFDASKAGAVVFSAGLVTFSPASPPTGAVGSVEAAVEEAEAEAEAEEAETAAEETEADFEAEATEADAEAEVTAEEEAELTTG